ncbi:MAG: 3-isopropylmalate dehydratase small subunit [Candidatus Micrarchaeia archaeon]|jgi:3-isopropylmalate/(R)-2-methylmalate dehydratase small subunit
MAKAYKCGDNVDTDVIIPARYLNSSDPRELGLHAMEDYDRDFLKKISPGDVVFAGKNFGCGSSREHAPIALKAAGVSCVVAKTFARIFYRNAVNIGLPVVECPEAADAVQAGDEVEVALEKGEIADKTSGKRFRAKPVPAFMMEIFRDGGLIGHLKKKFAKN